MPQRKQEHDSASLLTQEIDTEILAHLPRSFQALYKFASKEGEKDA